MALEQLPQFHLAKRIAKIVAPQYRLLSTPYLQKEMYALDSKKKTIEVSEQSDISTAVSQILFSLGHVLLEGESQFDLLFGKGLSGYDASKAVEDLSSLGERADSIAFEWAKSAMMAYFNYSEKDASQALSSCLWSNQDWKEYFSAV